MYTQIKSMSSLSKSRLRAISYLATNWFSFYQEIIAYVCRRLDFDAELIQAKSEPLGDSLLLNNQLDLAFICGLPLMKHSQNQFQILVAPVMAESRYQNRPIYFADVIVRVDSNIHQFIDLQGKIFCYNDLGSNSGYNMLRYRLSQGKYSQPFFAQTIQSYSHQNSIRWIVDGNADCSAIDSLVLERELINFPELSAQIRVLEVLDAAPIPPLVAANHLGITAIAQLQECLLNPDRQLQLAMKKMGVSHFVTMKLDDYRVLLEMSEVKYIL